MLRRQNQSARNRQSMRRVVIKQGYLKKLPNSAKFGSTIKKPERRWFVFGVMNFRDPYLEYYEDEDAIFQNQPINIIFLDNIIRVIRDQKTQRYQNMFTLILKDRHLSLVAQTRESMFEWSRAFEAQFRELGLIDSNMEGENDYVDIPNVTRPNKNRQLTRHPFTSMEENTDREESNKNNNPTCSINSNTTADDSQNNINFANGTPTTEKVYANVGSHLLRHNRPPYLKLDDTVTVNNKSQGLDTQQADRDNNEDSDGDVYENLWERNLENDYMLPTRSLNRQRVSSEESHIISTVSNENSPLVTDEQQERNEGTYMAMEVSRSTPKANNSMSYRHLDSDDSSSPPYISPLNSVPQSPVPTYTPQSQTTPTDTVLPSPLNSPTTPTSPYPGVFLNSPLNSPTTPIPDKMREALGMDMSTTPVGGWSVAPPVADDAPPPYMPRGMLERGANKSLKVSQVEQIKKQQSNPGGVRVILKKIDCHHTLALVHCFNAIWIAGWNQAARPFLQNAFHIGDQLISINGQVIDSTKMAYKLIKHCSETDKITFVIKRLPEAKLFTFKRLVSGEDLGFTREGGTGEIKSVDPSRIACQQGMPTMSPTLEEDNLCTWYLTEINNRPLNLFFKEKEIEHRLKAVGLDISIMVQPSQLVKEFKKQLKTMKYYKDYIVE